MVMKTLYIFRRDLRTYDNKALFHAYRKSEKIVPIYVFNETYLKDRGINLNSKWVRLVLNCLAKINEKMKLHVFIGSYKDVLERILSKYEFNSCFVSDSLSWSEEIENKEIESICSEYGVKLYKIVDNFLSDPREFKPTSTFSRFYRTWLRRINVESYPEVGADKFKTIGEETLEEFVERVRIGSDADDTLTIEWLESRKKAFRFEDYDRLRNFPYVDGSSRLSHFINIGAISVRELYSLTKDRSKKFIRQLAWREYYYAARFWYPWMNRLEVKEKMRGIKWENDENLIKAFFEGKTGYPIVDAGIRQLREEGWIHNRVRLIVASFLVKDLIVDWRIGEEFFRKHLIDFDEVLNIGNWQWSASVGFDPIPLRIFNPFIQSEKFDPRGEYIKRYLPELRDVRSKYLHNPLKYKIKDYVEPIVDHFEQIRKLRRILGERVG